MPCRAIMVLVLLFVVAVPVMYTQEAHAIPAFTRQYKTECSTCHTLYPELNEYGQAFLKNAYVYSEKQKGDKGAENKASAGKQGADTIDKNEGIRLSGIPELLPLSLTANQSIVYNEHSPDGDDWDFSTRSLVLQAGGAFRDLAGFYLTYNLFTHADSPTSTTAQTDNNKLDELFIVGRRLFSTPVNIKFGKFEPKLSLWKKSDKIIVTSFATTTYTEGSNPFTLQTVQDALEANAIIGKRVFAAAGIVDIKGQNTKDAYGHLSVKLGGADFLGNEPEMDLESESIWDYLNVTLATYGYSGRNADSTITSIKDNFYRFGGDMDLNYKRLRVKFSGVTGRDTNPDYQTTAAPLRSMVLSSEAEYFLGSPVNWVAVFRYEYQDDGTGIVRRYIPAVAYIPLQNVKLVLQYNHEDTPLVTNNIALLDISFSF